MVIVVFLVGALFEALYVYWTKAVTKRSRLSTALLSMTIGALSIYGVREAVLEPRYIPALLLGYGVGAYLTC